MRIDCLYSLLFFSKYDQYMNIDKVNMLIVSLFQTVLEQNGIQPGGLNFDCKVRRESTDLKDMFISHIGMVFMIGKSAFLYIS